MAGKGAEISRSGRDKEAELKYENKYCYIDKVVKETGGRASGGEPSR